MSDTRKWKTVPVELTPEMLEAAMTAANDYQAKMVDAAAPDEPVDLPADPARIIVCHRAILAASPAPQSGEPVALETTAEEREEFFEVCSYTRDILGTTGVKVMRDFDKLLAAPPPSAVGEIVAIIRDRANRCQRGLENAERALLSDLANDIEHAFRPAKEASDEA